MKHIILILLCLTCPVCAGMQTLTIEHPGIGGVNTQQADGVINMIDARELVNFDIVDGELVKRPGYRFMNTEGDTTCDGMWVYYNTGGYGQLLYAHYDDDSSFVTYEISDSNSYTYHRAVGSDQARIYDLYLYGEPEYGSDHVQFEDALIIANGKNHPTVYTRDISYGPLSLPTPGAPMVAPLNESGNLTGTYSYRLHYVADTAADYASANLIDTTQKSNPGPMSAYVFPDGEKVMLWGFPERASATRTFDSSHILITRTKAGGATYYVVDTLSYLKSDELVYIDNIADGSLGDSIVSCDSSICNCCEDSIEAPGEPEYAHDAAGSYNPKVLRGTYMDSMYFAYSYLDTTLNMESEIGPWRLHDPGSGQESSKQYFYVNVPRFGRNFIDGIIVYCSERNDSTRFRPFDTCLITPTDTCFEWCEIGFNYNPATHDWDSTDFDARAYASHPISNKIPYKYMAQSFGRLWGAGDKDYPSRLYYSGRTDMNKMGYWDMAFDYLSVDENDGEAITALVSGAEGVYVLKPHALWYASGVDPDQDMQLTRLSNAAGAVTNNAAISHNNALYFLSPEGKVYRGTQEISRKIANSLEDLSISTLFGAKMWMQGDDLWLSVNDTIFACETDDQSFPWKKYVIPNIQHAAYYDTTAGNYPEKKLFIFTKSGHDSMFAFDYTSADTLDRTSSIPILYKSPPLLVGEKNKIVHGKIQAEIPKTKSIIVQLLSLDNDTLSSVTITNDSKQFNDTYEFSFGCPVSAGYYLIVRDNGSCGSLTISKIELNYIRYAEYRP